MQRQVLLPCECGSKVSSTQQVAAALEECRAERHDDRFRHPADESTHFEQYHDQIGFPLSHTRRSPAGAGTGN